MFREITDLFLLGKSTNFLKMCLMNLGYTKITLKV